MVWRYSSENEVEAGPGMCATANGKRLPEYAGTLRTTGAAPTARGFPPLPDVGDRRYGGRRRQNAFRPGPYFECEHHVAMDRTAAHLAGADALRRELSIYHRFRHRRSDVGENGSPDRVVPGE